MPSGVSALSGCVANGHRAVRHVSSSPSKIPYGGFSPVRLQAGRRRQPSPAHARASRAYMPPKSLRPSHGVALAGDRRRGRREGEARPDAPAQRPLARRRVVLSRRVIAYYGLIRAPRPLPPAYGFAGRVFAFRAGAEEVPDLSRASFDPCRLPYPGGPGGRATVVVPPAVAFAL